MDPGDRRGGDLLAGAYYIAVSIEEPIIGDGLVLCGGRDGDHRNVSAVYCRFGDIVPDSADERRNIIIRHSILFRYLR